jgi:hypothetical protein
LNTILIYGTLAKVSDMLNHSCKIQCASLYNVTRVKIEKINNLFQVDINRREQGCTAHYEQYCQHVTVLFNCNNLEQHG